MGKQLEEIRYLVIRKRTYTEIERNIYLVTLYGDALLVLSCAEICYALPDLMDCEGFFPFWALYLLSLFATSQEWGIKTSNSDLVFFLQKENTNPQKRVIIKYSPIYKEKSENIKISLCIVLVNLICALTIIICQPIY